MRIIHMLAIIGAIIASPSLAQEKSPEFTASLKAEALKAFDNMAATATENMNSCRLQGKLDFVYLSLGNTPLGGDPPCVQIGKSSVSAKYAEMKAKIVGDKDALSALNDYAATLLAVFDDLRPRNHEREREYENRLDGIETDLRRKANLIRLQLQ